MKIAIVAAMKEELHPFEEHYAPRKEVFSKGPIRILEVHENLYLVQSGIGKANAAATAAWLCDKVQIGRAHV